MKAYICEKYGSPEMLTLAEVSKPVPKKDELLVKVHATSVNSGDVRIRALKVGEGMQWELAKLVIRFLVGFTGPRKKILGMVLAGEVVEVGDTVSSFKTGDKVFAMTGLRFGGYAEYAIVAEHQTVAHMPTTASFAEATALPFGGTTALYFLRKAGIERAKRVLIYGSTGAVGTAAIQIARSYGATVTAVCGEDGVELSRVLGAHAVYNYKTQPLTAITGQFDIIFDAVGKTTKAEVEHLLMPDAVHVTVGGMDTAQETAADLVQLARLFDGGALKAVIDRTYNFNAMVEAHRYVDTGRKKGNVVVVL